LNSFILDVIENKRKATDMKTKTMDIVDMMLAFHEPPFTTQEVLFNNTFPIQFLSFSFFVINSFECIQEGFVLLN
jgi:hypothetical protein